MNQSSKNESQDEKIIGKYRLNFQSFLGRGAYSSVYLGIDTEKDIQVAIKVMDAKLLENSSLKEGIQQEIKIMKALDSPYITKIYDVCMSINNLYLILEYCKDGDLRKFLTQKEKVGIISEKEAIKILSHILRGYKCLIENSIVHRDLKPENILFNDEYFKLSDFGLSKIISEGQILASIVGTPLYMSPQILKRAQYTQKSDIWSVGIIFFEILFGKTPWQAKTEFELGQKIFDEPLKFPYHNQISFASENFIKGCLQLDESQRISWNDIFHSELFNQSDCGDFPESQTFLRDRPKAKNPAEFDNLTIQLVRDIQATLVQMKPKDVNKLFSMLDKSKDNFLDIQEFSEFLLLINPKTEKDLIEHVFKKIDCDNSGTLNLAEFKVLLSEKDFSEYIKYRDPNIDEKADRVINRLKKKVQKSMFSIQKLFEKCDTSKNQQLEFEELFHLLTKIDKKLTRTEADYIFNKFDTNKDGTISIEEFFTIFIANSPTEFQKRRSLFLKEVEEAQKIKKISQSMKLDVKKEFELLSNNGDKLNFEQFQRYIKRLQKNYSETQLLAIFKYVDYDQDGQISFLEFQQIA